MTRTVLVTSTAEGTGKTAVAIALGLWARERGLDVGYMKPKGTRLRSRTGKVLDEDPLLAADLLDLEEDVDVMEPIVYSTTFVTEAIRGKVHPADLESRVREHFETIATDRDLTIVEGGRSVSTGGVVDLTDTAIADLVDGSAVLLVGYDRPEDLDDLLAAVDHLGDRFAGVLFNGVSADRHDDLETDVIPFLEGRGVPVYGVLPRDRTLAGVTIVDLAGEIGAEVLTEGAADAYVERFIVGAMSGDSALRYFRRTRDAAVITGGDRPAIQTAALEAPGIKCVILTGGYRPSETMLGKAEQADVAILLSQTDTRSTIDRSEAVISEGRTRDETTVDRMRELLIDHADVDSLLGLDT